VDGAGLWRKSDLLDLLGETPGLYAPATTNAAPKALRSQDFHR